MIADTMEGLELQLGDKLDAVFVHVRNLEGLAKTCDEEAKRPPPVKSHSKVRSST